MKHIRSTLLALTAIVGFAAAPAFAACPDTDTTASINDKASTGIAKDGTHAPLEESDAAKSDADPAKKDGKTMPLATGEGGGNKDLATSQQDVEAQQEGDKTAAATAQDDACAE